MDRTKRDVIIVGHLPFLQKFASLLITSSESSEVVKFKQGGVVCLERTNSQWSVAWMVVPELL
jgi:phosphohistidine phosphatase